MRRSKRNKSRRSISDSDIVLGDNISREPEESVPPEYDEVFFCKKWNEPSEELKIFITRDVYEQILNHTEEHSNQEIWGILLGNHCTYQSNEFLKITEIVVAAGPRRGIRRQSTFQEEFVRMLSEISTSERNEIIVGWCHIHIPPNQGVILCRRDKEIHNNWLSEPWHVAFIVTPREKDEGFFRYEDDKPIGYSGFYIYDTDENWEQVCEFVGRLKARRQYREHPIVNRPERPRERQWPYRRNDRSAIDTTSERDAKTKAPSSQDEDTLVITSEELDNNTEYEKENSSPTDTKETIAVGDGRRETLPSPEEDTTLDVNISDNQDENTEEERESSRTVDVEKNETVDDIAEPLRITKKDLLFGRVARGAYLFGHIIAKILPVIILVLFGVGLLLLLLWQLGPMALPVIFIIGLFVLVILMLLDIPRGRR